MKIRGEKLGKLMDAGGVSVSQLAQGIAEPGFDAARAESAIGNWLMNRDHPRCSAKTIARIATALRASPKDIARFTSEIRHHRGSPRKARLLADLIRGKKVDVAVNLLTFTTKRAAVNLKKALNAAIADAELNDADVTRLVIVESRVNEGSRIKRFQPKDRGRAHPIIKTLSHITIGVEEK